MIDIGCGNGRDSIFFGKKGYFIADRYIKTTIKKKTIMKNKNLSFSKFDIENDTTTKNLILFIQFLCAKTEKGEIKLIKL